MPPTLALTAAEPDRRLAVAGPRALEVLRPPAAVATDASGSKARLAGSPFFDRAAWGADESLRFGPGGAELSPPAFWPVRTVTLHHTATANDDPDPAATVRALYRFHAAVQGFGDVGYHFLVDEDGRTYQGRWSGGGPVPAHDAEGGVADAAHLGGFDAGNVGVALLGTFADRRPTAAARRSLTLLVALLAAAHGLDLHGTTGDAHPVDGTAEPVLAVGAPRDPLAAARPGEALAPTLERVRADATWLLRLLVPERAPGDLLRPTAA